MPTHLNSLNFEELVHKEVNAIIDFSAEWCTPCKRMEPLFAKAETVIKQNGTEIDFFKVDVNESEDISTVFEIAAMPTLIVIKNGKPVEKSEGYKTCEQILALIGKHFDVSKSSEKDNLSKIANMLVKQAHGQPQKQNQVQNNSA